MEKEIQEMNRKSNEVILGKLNKSDLLSLDELRDQF